LQLAGDAEQVLLSLLGRYGTIDLSLGSFEATNWSFPLGSLEGLVNGSPAIMGALVPIAQEYFAFKHKAAQKLLSNAESQVLYSQMSPASLRDPSNISIQTFYQVFILQIVCIEENKCHAIYSRFRTACRGTRGLIQYSPAFPSWHCG
jgi:hypothetical protein